METVELKLRIIEETEEYEDCLITRTIEEHYVVNPKISKLREIWENESSVSEKVVGHFCSVNCPKTECKSI